jgi:hypothetical protein
VAILLSGKPPYVEEFELGSELAQLRAHRLGDRSADRNAPPGKKVRSQHRHLAPEGTAQ